MMIDEINSVSDHLSHSGDLIGFVQRRPSYIVHVNCEMYDDTTNGASWGRICKKIHMYLR